MVECLIDHQHAGSLACRLFLLSDQLQRTRRRLDAYFEDPNSIPIIRKEISDASRNVIQLQEMLS